MVILKMLNWMFNGYYIYCFQFWNDIYFQKRNNMFKVYLNNKLIGTFEKDIDAAICACNNQKERTDKVDVYGPKSDFIHFKLGER